jgi:hypothetical protein
MTTITELNGSGKLEFRNGRWRGERIYRITPFADVEAFCTSMLGSETDGSDGQVLRTPPVAFAQGSRLVATGCRTEGLGRPALGGDGQISYDGGARVVIEFSVLNYEIDDSSGDPDDPANATYLTEEIRIAGESISLAKSRLMWSSDSEPLSGDDTSPGRLIPKAEWILTRHRVPILPRLAIFSSLGKVNSTALGDAEVGTLLFLGAEARREFSTQGDPRWRITMTFLYHPETHNQFFRPQSGTWDGIVTVDGSQPIYESADLRSLIPELG